MNFSDRIVILAQKTGNQIHLRSLRDAFASLLPFFILSGFMILINNMIIKPDGILSNFINNDRLSNWQEFGNSIINGSLNFISILVAGSISYHLCLNKGYKDLLTPILVSISVIIIFMPDSISLINVLNNESVEVKNAISYSQTGSQGMFVGIFTALLSTSLLIKLNSIKWLKINLGDSSMIPPAVVSSFNTLIPVMVTIIIFSLISFLVKNFLGMDISTLISTLIQVPLKSIATGLPGLLIITSIANAFFTIGIHQAVITGSVLDPFLLANMQENMIAFANHQPIPNIISIAFKDTFGLIGGSGNTLALLIAIFIFSKRRDQKDVAKLSIAPGLFNINEPVIFGLPIVFNPILAIPFILSPVLSFTTAYYATYWGWIDYVTVQIPWTTPTIISGFLATAGDWRASVLQAINLVICIFVYLPFLKFSERVALASQNQ